MYTSRTVLFLRFVKITAESSESHVSRKMCMVEALLQAGANPNVKSKEEGFTAGHTLFNYQYDSYYGKLSTYDFRYQFDLLVKFGLDLEERCNEGETLLLMCSGKRSKENIKCLVEAGANVNAADNFGHTVLMRVVKCWVPS